MELLRLILFITALLFILLQRVDVRIAVRNGLTVKINFTFFAIVFKKSGITLRRKWRYKGIVGKMRAFLKSARYLLKKADIEIFESSSDTYKNAKISKNIEVVFHFTLFRLIISATFLLYYIVKSKVKRAIKNV